MIDRDSVIWRKSSYSGYNGNCVEVAWRKSSYSVGNGACVETATGCGQIHVRDSKDPDGPVLEFSPGAWAEFLDGVRDGPDELATYVAEAMADPEFAAAYEAAGQEDIPTNQEDNSGVPLDELARRRRGATFSSSI